MTPPSTKPTLTTLPLEIRRHVYSFVLPSSDFRLNTEKWSKLTSTANSSMGLLLVNKQILAEARDVIYGCNSFTLTISKDYAYLLNNRRQDLSDFKPFPETPAIKQVRNWQIDLQLDPSYRSKSLGCPSFAPHLGSPLHDSQFYIHEGILSASVEMVKAKDLQTLKLCFPCLCGINKRSKSVIERVRKAIAWSIEPLQQLRFKSSVKFIATPSGSAPSWTWPYLLPIWELNTETTYMQCEEPHCLKFVGSFEYLRRLLTSKTVPPSKLTTQQEKWFDLKVYALDLLPREPSLIQRDVLFQAWCSTEMGEDVFEARYLITQRWIEHEAEMRRREREVRRLRIKA
ncbi:MAG: hypothetical protein Q9213_001316 [Squamulea squamosa]